MAKSFEAIQKNYFKNPELKRFYWQTQNIYVKQQEIKLLSMILEKIQLGNKILEIGCGEGANIVNLLSHNIDNEITAIDFSQAKIDFCNNLNLKNTTFICADAKQLPFEDNQFDIVYMRDLLHHVNNERKAVIDEALRVTKSGQTLFIIEPNYNKLTNFVYTNIFKHEIGIKDSTKEKLSLLLAQYNYNLKSVEASNFFRILLHYSMGLPFLAKLKCVSFFLNSLDKLFQRIIPDEKWGYWLIKIYIP